MAALSLHHTSDNFGEEGREVIVMRRLLNLKIVVLLLVVLAANTEGLESHARERARQYEPLIAAAAQRHGVDPHLLWTIAYQETRFQPHLISPKGARG